MVDDLGWQDTSLPFWENRTYYNQIYETPNMELLAKQGMMFTQAYACSVSSPSRCSLMTGTNNARHRVTNWTLKKSTPTDIKNDTITPPDWNYNGICQVEGVENTFAGTSFVDILKKSGYHTIHCGKAHFGAIDTPGARPEHFGFDVNIAGHAAGGLATYLSEKNYGHNKNGEPYALNAIPHLQEYWNSGTFATEALTQEAIKSLEKTKEDKRPFFLYMSHYAVHIPIEPDKCFYNKYLAKGLSEKEAAYASLIEGVDKSLGDLLRWLEDNDKAKNTIVIFMSDNGGLSSAREWRDGTLHTQNYPLKSGKGSLYEGGIRVPFIISWKDKTAPGSICNEYVMIEDLYPTILEMAGIQKYETLQPIDGTSIVPLFTGKNLEERSLIWNFPNIWGNNGPGINLNCAIRKGDWKLIYNYKDGSKELYNIAQDIGEIDNLIESHRDIADSLSVELGEYLRNVNAQRPYNTLHATPCKWPDEK